MRQIAQKNNGECLSDHYISNKHHLKWHCFGCDRVWEATPGPILAGLWCGSCRKMVPYMLEIIIFLFIVFFHTIL